MCVFGTAGRGSRVLRGIGKIEKGLATMLRQRARFPTNSQPMEDLGQDSYKRCLWAIARENFVLKLNTTIECSLIPRVGEGKAL